MFKFISTAVAALIIAIGVNFNGAQASSANFPLAQMYNSSVDIYNAKDTDNYICSGVIVSPTLVLTANHCLTVGKDGVAEKMAVGFKDGSIRQATVLKHEAAADWALLYTPVPDSLPAASLGCRKAVWGEEVALVGNPLGIMHAISFGHVAALDIKENGGRAVPDYVAVDASATFGNSGGPVFDVDGKVIGLLVQAQIFSTWGYAWQTGFNFFTPVEAFCNDVKEMM